MSTRRSIISWAACLALTGTLAVRHPAQAVAQDIAKPTGDVLLTIDGEVSTRNTAEGADFDMQMLQAMPSTKFRTSTPWTDGVKEFEGVLLKDLFAAVGASGKSIKASALNDYIAELDLETMLTSGAILAYRVDGADISVRDKGPLWIMFPFDEKPQLKAETIYSQSVWQLRKLTFAK